jgi:hypothetical protein
MYYIGLKTIDSSVLIEMPTLDEGIPQMVEYLYSTIHYSHKLTFIIEGKLVEHLAEHLFFSTQEFVDEVDAFVESEWGIGLLDDWEQKLVRKLASDLKRLTKGESQ